MPDPRRIVVLGATGRTGHELVRQALAAGHRVVAVARRPDALADRDHPALEAWTADVDDPATLAGVTTGADAVVSALGPRDGRAPTEVCSRGVAAAVADMRRTGVRRLLAVSAVPVSDAADKTRLDRWVVHPLLHRLFGPSYADLRRMEAALRAADDLDWTVVRPPQLVEAATGRYRSAVGGRLPAARHLGRADLATAMLAGLDDPTWYRTVVTVAA